MRRLPHFSPALIVNVTRFDGYVLATNKDMDPTLSVCLTSTAAVCSLANERPK